ncbi:heparinase II/III family protein [Pseudogemmobacter sonorensis]|uniref:heparinase II/III family protein n=1 Tax=Pseudogemmobacter sonorensis TaxID=2989681 RepID=UPI00368F5F2E
MEGPNAIPSGRERLANRYAAWRAGRKPTVTAFVSQPEPRSFGLHARGKQILAGNILLAGHLAEAPGKAIWDIPLPDAAFGAEAHGFAWLDDLAALGTPQARRLAQDWTGRWIARFGQGRGPGWTPGLTGRRMIRWIHHAAFLMSGQDKAAHDAWFAALARQTAFLARRAPAAAPGLPRFEAQIGLLYAGLSLAGMDPHAAPAARALARECAAQIDAGGAIASRNPEELAEILTLLAWAVRALAEAERPIPAALSQAIDRIAPCLRVLRHSDGSLPRFHGGGAGIDGRLDQALSASAMLRPPGHAVQAMGYMRLSGGRSSVILDAADPPGGAARAGAHASTGAFELTSGRRPLIVNCGSGRPFGVEWRLAGRATQSHSALSISGASSSRFGSGTELLEERARVTSLRQSGGEDALVVMAHDGWVATHGLLAGRELHLSSDGRRLGGTDTLSAQGAAAQARFSMLLDRSKLEGIGFTIRFHLHPEVDATLDMGGHAVSMQLRSGEIWVFRHDGRCRLSLDASVFLEKGRLKPRPAQQIVLSGRAREFETRIGWTLAKAQDTPLAIRDLDRDEPVPI